MAKRGRKGGSSAARSAAAKKGWETRRRGGAGAAGKASKPTKASKGTVAQRKAALVKQVSSNALAGRANSKAARSYVRAQQGEKMRMQGGGKGNKAAKRAAAVTAKAAQTARAKQFSGKAAPNKAKANYKAAKSKARKLSWLNGTSYAGKAKNAVARVKRMESSRRASRSRV